MKGRWQETALALGLLFAVLMNTQLLLPNPYMPETVRMTHLIETASSNFFFGLLVGWLLTQHHVFAKVSMAKREMWVNSRVWPTHLCFTLVNGLTRTVMGMSQRFHPIQTKARLDTHRPQGTQQEYWKFPMLLLFFGITENLLSV